MWGLYLRLEERRVVRIACASSLSLDSADACARVAACCAAAGDGDSLFDGLSGVLGRYVAFDGALWFATDPATLLATCPARIENVEPGHCATFWQREFMVQDANLFCDVARGGVPAVSLHATTDRRPARSARWREFLAPQGYDDELRIVFRTGDLVWGVAALFRARGRVSFDAGEMALAAAVSGPVATYMRGHSLLRREGQRPGGDAPGMITFDGAGTLMSLNEEATDWLAELPTGHGGSEAVGVKMPVEVLTVVARARAIAAGTEHGVARLRVRSRAGRWLVLHASALRDTSDRVSSVALIIEPAQGIDIASILVEAYQLTAREQQITQLIARGVGTSDIAARLYLSSHTVRDHIKAIFEKVGVTSRGELVAELFAEHYGPGLHQHAIHTHISDPRPLA
jgi:DNA-binding CsgD family transcriptional regulator